MKSPFLRAALYLAWITAGSVFAGETTLTDDDSLTAWLYTPTEKPDPARRSSGKQISPMRTRSP